MIPASMLPSLILYAFVSSVSPGPANLCSLASAMKYGRRQALLQWRGLFTGFTVVSLSSAAAVWFLGSVLNQYLRLLKYVGAAYILWLAFQILKSSGPGDASAKDRCNFFTGFFLQLTNAKIWVYCMTTLTSYFLPYAESFRGLLIPALLLPFTGPMANLLWLFSGVFLQDLFRKYHRPLNLFMAAALVFSAVSIALS